MKRSNQHPRIQGIPLDKLKKSDENVRKTPHTQEDIKALANSIDAHGQIQNLVVKTEQDAQGNATGFYLVTAGEGRRLAQLFRVKRKKIKADHPILCLIDDTHSASAVSLAENDLRRAMHPADQFVAFKQLVDGGQSVEEIAAQFSVTPLVVQRRLKIANVAPEFLALYRKKGIDLDSLMALAISDDHEKQRQAWANLPKYDRRPESLRRALTENEISVQEAVVKFVSLKTYEKAGGLIRRDLFAERPDDGFVMDAELLRRLAAEKLAKAAAQLKEDGYAWVEVIPQLDYATLSTFGRVQHVLREASGKETIKLDALKKQLADIETQAQASEDDEDRFSELSDQAETIEAQIDALQDKRKVPHAQQQALAGAVVSISHGGELRVEKGLLRPEDAKRIARDQKVAIKDASPGGPRIHSAALVRRLTAHKTLALQATLAQRPNVALVALTHRLALRTFFNAGYSATVVQIEAEETSLDQYAPDVEGSKAQATLVGQGKVLRSMLPDDPATLFVRLLQMPQDDVLRLCAYCVAMTLNGVSADEESHALDTLADAAELDMREWWAPTAENYLGSVPKARILEVVREAVSPEAAATLTSLKKDALAAAAEQRLAGTGWLPGPLRGQAA